MNFVGREQYCGHLFTPSFKMNKILNLKTFYFMINSTK